MTVCVAAIGWGGDTIIGASDRMVTARDIQFEPDSSKSVMLTRSIVAMLAGDASLQGEIYSVVRPRIRAAIEDDPENWISVADAAHWWAEAYGEISLREAENSILRPLALDRETFYSKQHDMSDDFITNIGNQLLQFKISSVSTIITGVDETGPHIYIVEDGHSYSADRIGFASIGIGSRHANSQLMFRGHTPTKDLPETLLSVYMAKKRADEVAPGVGADTDMFTIGPQLGTYSVLPENIQTRLADEYQRLRQEEERATAEAERGMKGYVEEILGQQPEARPSQEATPEGAEEGTGAIDETDIPDDAEEDEGEADR